MKVKTVVEGSNEYSMFYVIPNDLNRDFLKIGILAWFPVFKDEYKKNIYLELLTDDNQSISLGIININNTVKNKTWQKIRIQDVVLKNIPKSAVSLKIFAKGMASNLFFEDCDKKFKDWKFHLILVDKEENLNMRILEQEALEPENVSESYCKTINDNRKIGAECPNKSEKCRIFERLDDVGRSCVFKYMKSKESDNNDYKKIIFFIIIIMCIILLLKTILSKK